MLKEIVGLFGLLAIGTLGYLSPMFKPFPKPTGKFAVGTLVLEFTDAHRKEEFSENPDDFRRLVIRAFYPADVSLDSEQFPYLGAKKPYYQKFIATLYNIPDAIAQLLLRGIGTHTYINPPLDKDKDTYPVVLFSHGLLGLPSDTSLSILENIASNGYIVFAIDHSYLNALTLFEDGSMATSLKLSAEFNKMSVKEQYAFQSKAIEIYKNDMRFIIDQLEILNATPESKFFRRLNLGQIAVMGHSAGGTASIEFCRDDHRCGAAIDLDGWYDQTIGDQPINKPLLLLFGSKSLEVSEPSAEYLKRKELTRDQYFEREKNIAEHRKKLCSVPSCSFVIIPDATHNDFGDEIFFKWPLRSWQEADAYRTNAAINDHIITFLNRSFAS